MLVTFSTDAYADITMFGDVAIRLLKMMGHSGTVPSAILAADIPEALQRLNKALNTESVSPPANSNDGKEQAVSMANRAMPLISLLSAAAKENTDVLWK
jgi:hypothetical protein